MSITSNLYGRTQSGKDVFEYILSNDDMTVHIIEYGATITKIIVPDKNKKPTDVILGYDDLETYEKGGAFHGAFVGRVANRIKGSAFEIDDKIYHLQPNDGKNHLHGTLCKYVFNGKIQGDSLVLETISPDGDDGFPGDLNIKITYTLTAENGIVMDYIATTNESTIINLTNHSYFNLNGHSSGDILNHKLLIDANEYTPANDEICPTGEIAKTTMTPMDFTNFKTIGEDINKDFDQLTMAGGYDHNYILNKEKGELAMVVRAIGDESNIMMEMLTTQPGVQFYTGNFLENDTQTGKNETKYKKRNGFCLETQHYPCATSYNHFPSIVLRPNEEYHHTTIYEFSVVAKK